MKISEQMSFHVSDLWQWSEIQNIQFVAQKRYFCNFLLLWYHLMQKNTDIEYIFSYSTDLSIIYTRSKKGPTFIQIVRLKLILV